MNYKTILSVVDQARLIGEKNISLIDKQNKLFHQNLKDFYKKLENDETYSKSIMDGGNLFTKESILNEEVGNLKDQYRDTLWSYRQVAEQMHSAGEEIENKCTWFRPEAIYKGPSCLEAHENFEALRKTIAIWSEKINYLNDKIALKVTDMLALSHKYAVENHLPEILTDLHVN